jgi:putative transposase
MAKAMSPNERREMICHPAVDPSGSMRGRKENTELSLTRQCKLLKISRSSIYYTPVGFDPATLDLMHEIDRVFTSIRSLGAARLRLIFLSRGSLPDGIVCVA